MQKARVLLGANLYADGNKLVGVVDPVGKLVGRHIDLIQVGSTGNTLPLLLSDSTYTGKLEAQLEGTDENLISYNPATDCFSYTISITDRNTGEPVMRPVVHETKPFDAEVFSETASGG